LAYYYYYISPFRLGSAVHTYSTMSRIVRANVFHHVQNDNVPSYRRMCVWRTHTHSPAPRTYRGPKKLQRAFRARVRGIRATVINRRRHGRRRRVRARLAAKVHRFARSRPTDDDRATVTHCCACLLVFAVHRSRDRVRRRKSFSFFKPFFHLPPPFRGLRYTVNDSFPFELYR